jgi:hypothetical protein
MAKPFRHLDNESQRDSSSKPRVARNELPWEHKSQAINPNGVVASREPRAATQSGLRIFLAVTQGSSVLATLGYMIQFLRDCKRPRLLGWS